MNVAESKSYDLLVDLLADLLIEDFAADQLVEHGNMTQPGASTQKPSIDKGRT